MRQEKRTYKTLATLLALLLVISLTGFVVAGCGGSADKKEGVEKKNSESTEKTSGEATEGEGERSAQEKAQEGRVSDESNASVLYVQNCGACHGHDGSGVVGPALKGIALSVEQIKAQIENGGGQMPAFKGGELSEKQIEVIASYVKNTLK